MENKVAEYWDCWDPRLPKEILRNPPEDEFVESVRIYGVMQPIMIGYNIPPYEEWCGIVFGRKRLLAVRQLLADGLSDGLIPVFYEQMDRESATIRSLIENCHRSKNDIGAFDDIRRLMAKGNDYKKIAQMINASVGYVKTIEKKYARVPHWAISAGITGAIATGTVEALSSVGPTLQNEARKFFEENKKLTRQNVADLRRLRNEQFSQALPGNVFGEAISTKRPFIPREELEYVLSKMQNGEYNDAEDRLFEILSL